MSSLPQPSCCAPSAKLNANIVWFAAGIALVCGLSFQIDALVPFRENFLMYLSKVWWAVLLGLVIGGWIERFVSREYVSHQLARNNHQSILKSVGLGFLMSACCHGIMAIAVQLYRKGASTSSVIAFLLASPWANLTWTIFLIGFFGWKKSLYIIGISLLIAVITGLIFQILESSSKVEVNPNTIEPNGSQIRFWNVPSGRGYSGKTFQDDCDGIFRGMVSLGNMVLFWALLGMTLAAAIAAYVPTHWMHEYMGPTFLGLSVTLLLASVIEVCSEGSTPIAFEIYRQTGALGNSLVFLLAGVATDYTEIAILWKNIGPRTAFWVPVLTIPQILFWGWVGNMIF